MRTRTLASLLVSAIATSTAAAACAGSTEVAPGGSSGSSGSSGGSSGTIATTGLEYPFDCNATGPSMKALKDAIDVDYIAVRRTQDPGVDAGAPKDDATA